MRPQSLCLIALLALAGCSNDVISPPVERGLGAPIPIPYGHSAIVEGAGIGLKFVGVQDGRCPRGALCGLVASSAVVGISVFPTGGGPVVQNAPSPISLEIAGLEDGTTAAFGSYDIHLAKLTPYLAPGEVAAPSDYVATLVVTLRE